MYKYSNKIQIGVLCKNQMRFFMTENQRKAHRHVKTGMSHHYFCHYWLTSWTSLNFWDRTKQPHSQSSDYFEEIPVIHSLQVSPSTFSKILTQIGPGCHPDGCKHCSLSDQDFVWCLVTRMDITVGCPESIPSSCSVLFWGTSPPTFHVVWILLTVFSTSIFKGGHMTRSRQSGHPILHPWWLV